MNWRYRLAKVLVSWLTGYSGGFSAIFTLSAYEKWEFDFTTLFLIPAISGLVVGLPQLAKVINEWANRGLREKWD